MKEIIHIQAGRCGNHIGTKFWEEILKEHGIGPDGTYIGTSELQLERIDVYFKEMEGYKYFPRAILVDMEPATLDTVLQSPRGTLFQSDNFVFGRGSASNNWAKGFYREGRGYIDAVMEVVRQEAEISDSLQGFHLTHSLGGGTGSGLGALIITKIREQYPNRTISSFSTFPSVEVMGVITEAYNTTLSVQQLVENVDATFCIDNEALHRIVMRALGIRWPNYDDLNHLASMAMSRITSFLRLSGQFDSDLRKLIVSMVPFPRLHFLTSAFVPLTAQNIIGPRLEVNELIQQLFDARNLITACDPRNGRYLAAAAMVRGQISVDEVENHILSIRNILVAEWLPNNIKLDGCELPARGTRVSSAFLGNTTAIKEVFFRIREQFEAMFRRRAFLHWYTGEGMEETEFIDAGNNMKSLISEYENCQNILDDGDPSEAVDDMEEQGQE
ncbi:beta-tubulin [Loa loa]|uniref:Tubulin beta chain n=1 Tax=Loa loa TaxID=7209 RepID=A0A1I7VD00_LOALO|nr:beta-tubulin [Loa loa]EFO16681.1 beta-tubulin [Loa loa]